jgi:dihydrofolate reductase
MKVTLMVVMSLDARTTKGRTAGAGWWASPEDQEVFRKQLAACDRIVMGSATYEAARSVIVPSAAKPRIIVTRNPGKYARDAQPGLTFSKAAPRTIVAQAKAAGCKNLLLLGGAQTAARFIGGGLVDELLVTIEPLFFADGKPLVAPLTDAVRLRLVQYKQLNKQGTLLARYIVVR